MMKHYIPYFLLLLVLIAGCAKQPTGQLIQAELTPEGIDQVEEEAGEEEQTSEEVAPEKEAELEEESAEETVVEAGKVWRISITEGELLQLNLEATDPDGDPLTYTFSSPLNEKGEWQTEVGDAGEYPVTITVSDGTLETSKNVLIIVKALNRPPVLEPPKDITVTEGQKVIFDLKATDPDEDELTWRYSSPISADGTWQTTYGDRGKYAVTVTVSDGQADDTASFFITVLAGNQPPVLKVEGEMTVNEGETITLEPEVSDPDGDEVIITYSGWMTTSTYKTNYDDEGRHKVVVTASDGELSESQIVWITVNNVNRPPVIHGLIVK